MRIVLYSVFIFLFGVYCFLFFRKGEHVCNPDRVIIKTTTDYKVIPRVDTLVVIETIKLKPFPDSSAGAYVSSSSVEIQPFELFKNGKTRDTIIKETFEYY